MKIQKRADIYFGSNTHVKEIDVVQYDTGIELVFTARDFDIPTGTTATIFIKKPSGKYVYQGNGVTVADNKITVALENQAITENGEAYYQLQLLKDNNVISSFVGVLEVAKSLNNDSAIESTTVITVWDKVIQEAINKADKLMVFKAVTVSSALPTENVAWGDTYYLLDKNAFAVAYVYNGTVTWFKTAEIPHNLDFTKCMTFKGVRFPQQGLPTDDVYYGDTYFVGNGPTDVNGYYAVAYVADGNVNWFKTQSITVDSELSKTSINPVQNKIVTNELINLTQWQKATDDITIEDEAESQAITLNGNYKELVVRIEYPADTASSAANGQIEYKVTNANGTVTTVAGDSLNKGAKYITSTFINAMGIVIMENTSLQYQAQASTSKRTAGVNITTHYLNNLTISIPTDGWKLKVGTTIKIYGKRYYS